MVEIREGRKVGPERRRGKTGKKSCAKCSPHLPNPPLDSMSTVKKETNHKGREAFNRTRPKEYELINPSHQGVGERGKFGVRQFAEKFPQRGSKKEEAISLRNMD